MILTRTIRRILDLALSDEALALVILSRLVVRSGVFFVSGRSIEEPDEGSPAPGMPRC